MGDTLSLTGKKLYYDDARQTAQIFDDVTMKDRKIDAYDQQA
jgi:hypothetical protein